ncbi:hypothetical protein SUGI_0365550 [Cryptomeria japonica]|nr:hypothetical protein SUGI_0365550 [Cryptomeria japonica]
MAPAPAQTAPPLSTTSSSSISLSTRAVNGMDACFSKPANGSAFIKSSPGRPLFLSLRLMIPNLGLGNLRRAGF